MYNNSLVLLYYKKITDRLNEEFAKNDENPNKAAFTSLIDCSKLKEFIKDIIEKGNNHLLDDDFISYLVYRAIGSNGSRSILNTKMIYDDLESLMMELTYEPTKLITSLINGFIAGSMNYYFTQSDYRRKMSDDFIDYFDPIRERICDTLPYDSKLKEDAYDIFIHIIYIIYGYCIYYKMENKLFTLIKYVIHNIGLIYDKLLINRLISNFNYGTYVIQKISVEDIEFTNYIIDEVIENNINALSSEFMI